MIARALLFPNVLSRRLPEFKVFSSFRVLKTTVIVTRKVTIWVRVCQGGINSDSSGAEPLKPRNTTYIQRQPKFRSGCKLTMPAGKFVEDSSPACFVVLWIPSAVSLSIRLEFRSFFLLCSRFCHSTGRYDQPVKLLPFSFMHLRPRPRIFRRSAVHDLLASFEVVGECVSPFLSHRFHLSVLDEYFVG